MDHGGIDYDLSCDLYYKTQRHRAFRLFSHSILERIRLLSVERKFQASQLRVRRVSFRQLSLGLIQHILDKIFQLLLGAVQGRSEFLKLSQFRTVFPKMIHFARHSPQILVFGWKRRLLRSYSNSVNFAETALHCEFDTLRYLSSPRDRPAEFASTFCTCLRRADRPGCSDTCS